VCELKTGPHSTAARVKRAHLGLNVCLCELYREAVSQLSSLRLHVTPFGSLVLFSQLYVLCVFIINYTVPVGVSRLPRCLFTGTHVLSRRLEVT
jgi:hypothetical protein